MPPRKPSSPVLDTGDGDASTSDALALAEQAEAEAVEAEAAATAARARARAIRLRNEAATAEPTADEPSATDTDAEGDGPVEIAQTAATELTEPAADPVKRWARVRGGVQIPRLFWKVLASSLTVITIAALLAASGWMIWQHREAQHRQQLVAEYTAAAKQSVVTLMSLNFNHAEEDVQRILDSSTGEFKEDFEDQAKDFVKLAHDAKVITEATTNVAAVENMTDDSAVVLVAVTSTVTNSAGAKQDPRPWRVAAHMARDGDQIKLAKVEFVP